MVGKKCSVWRKQLVLMIDGGEDISTGASDFLPCPQHTLSLLASPLLSINSSIAVFPIA